MSLTPVAEAQARLLAMKPALEPEELPLAACIGRWLAQDVTALRDQPWSDLSAMDGYAVRNDDLSGPWTVIGESAAGGGLPPPIAAGEALRIFTGAPLPEGGGTVIMQENIAREGDWICLLDGIRLRAGIDVREKGSDFVAGQPLLSIGALCNPPQLALAAVAGHAALRVGRRPRVAILSTGSELALPGAMLRPGQIPSSNAIMLRAMLASLPCIVEDLGIVEDDMDRLVAAISGADADIIVTTGGASVGDHDLVQDALKRAGGSLDFWKVRMRPGKPLIVGSRGEALFIGLPGNPVSAFVTATLFLLPLVRHLGGSPWPLPHITHLPTRAAMPAGGSRDEYLRATITADGNAVDPIASRDSAGLRALAQADALIVRPASCSAAEPGAPVPVIRLY